MSNYELFAPFTVEGACNRTMFETWLETCLIPSLQPGQVIIADNATLLTGLLSYRAIYFPICDRSIISIHTGFLVKNSGSSLPGMLIAACCPQTIAIKPKMAKKSNNNRF